MNKNNQDRNPRHNPHLQALLDLEDLGYKSLVEDMIKTLCENANLQEELTKLWNNRFYNDDSITWASVTINSALFKLSAEAWQIATLLGLYASQSGNIQITRSTIMAMTNIKKTALDNALKELKARGVIKILIKQARHEAPVYAVNKHLICVGKRNKASFKPDCATNDYVLNPANQAFDDDLFVNTELIHTELEDRKVVYRKVKLQKKESQNPSIDEKCDSFTQTQTHNDFNSKLEQLSMHDIDKVFIEQNLQLLVNENE